VALGVAVVAAALAPAIVCVPLFPLEDTSVRPAPSTSVNVTLAATLGPRFTSATV
jgi:hypothetical protein